MSRRLSLLAAAGGAALLESAGIRSSGELATVALAVTINAGIGGATVKYAFQ